MNGLTFSKYINENVFGTIPVTQTEFDLINTLAFQRLRNIKQLGLANLVFPAADHTRFSHSLGVMHIVGKMAERLYQLDVFSQEEIKKLRIAGLLHDIGHYPLSHLGEKVYMYQKPLRKPKGGQPFNSLEAISGKSENEDAHHENIGKYVIQNRKEISNILERDNIDPVEIAKIIRAEHTNSIYGQLIHSGLDADRLDYLLRDSLHTGSKYGLVDLEYLLRSLEIKMGSNQEQWVGISEKAIHAAEHFLMARYFAYSQVTWHKTIRGFETIAGALFLDMRLGGHIYRDVNEIKQIVDDDEWLSFTDDYFYKELAEYSEGNINHIQQNLISCLKKRRRAKLICEVKVFKEQDRDRKSEPYLKYKALYNLLHEKREKVNEVIAKHNIAHSLAFDQELNLNIDKVSGSNSFDDLSDENLKESILIIGKNNIYPITFDSSSILKPLSNRKLYCLRLYVVDPNPNLSVEDSDKFLQPLMEEINKLYEEELNELTQEVTKALSL